MSEAIRIENVTKRFGDQVAVNDISLEIEQGEFFSLLGPSGCGKTTTLRMLAGFEVPSDGRIMLDGKPVENVPPYKRDVNMVFQSYALFEHLDIADNVAFGLRRKKVAKEEIRRRVGEALELVNLSERASARANELSGGQKQRVALARALVNRPKVLLLDEPLGALDLKLRRQMQVELKAIQREVGITFVYVTHDQEEALSMSDRIAVMNSGRVAQCGAPEDVYEHPTEEFVAGFIGISNLISGVAEDGGKVRIATGLSIPAQLPDDVSRGDQVNLSIRPEKIAIDEEVGDGMVTMQGTIESRVYLGVMTQITVTLGDGARLVALEQAWHRSRADDRWEPGMTVRIGWHARAQPGAALSSRRVIAVGAGLAGLAAADALARGGYEVEVVEARDRVGGRTWSRELANGVTVEMGAEFILAGNTEVRGLAAELGLELVDKGMRYGEREPRGGIGATAEAMAVAVGVADRALAAGAGAGMSVRELLESLDLDPGAREALLVRARDLHGDLSRRHPGHRPDGTRSRGYRAGAERRRWQPAPLARAGRAPGRRGSARRRRGRCPVVEGRGRDRDRRSGCGSMATRRSSRCPHRWWAGSSSTRRCRPGRGRRLVRCATDTRRSCSCRWPSRSLRAR